MIDSTLISPGRKSALWGFVFLVPALFVAVPGILVRKGPATRIIEAGRLVENTTGNPGLATAGSGDVLSGVIGALLARGDSPLVAARRGVWLHGAAGDRARDRIGVESMIAEPRGGNGRQRREFVDVPFAEFFKSRVHRSLGQRCLHRHGCINREQHDRRGKRLVH